MNTVSLYFALIFSILCSLLSVDAQNFNILNQTNFGGNSQEFGNIIRPQPNGGFYLLSRSMSNISGNKTENSKGGFDIWVVSVDENNSILWDKTIGGVNDEDAFDAVLVGDELIIAVQTNSPISGDKTIENIGGADIWIFRLDSSGNIIWQNIIGGTDNERTPKLTFHNNELIVSFSTLSTIIQGQDPTTNGSLDVVTTKVDPSNGQVMDAVYLGVDNNDTNGPVISTGLKIIQTTQLSYGNSLGGTYPEPEFPDVANIGISVLNDDLSIDTAFSIGGSGDDVISDFLYDGTYYYIVGYSNSPVSGDKTQPPFGSGFPSYDDFWLVKMDSQFNIMWDKVYGTIGSDAASNGYIDNNGKLVIVGLVPIPNSNGNKISVGFGSTDTWCIVINENTGDKIGDFTFGGSGEDYSTGFTRTSDGRYLLSMITNSSSTGVITTNSYGMFDDWVAELDCSAILEVPETNDVAIDFYPNPVNHEFTIKGDLAKFEQLKLSSIDGRQILQQTISVGSHSAIVDVSQLPSGLYVLELQGIGLSQTRRVLKH